MIFCLGTGDGLGNENPRLVGGGVWGAFWSEKKGGESEEGLGLETESLMVVCGR